METKIKYVSVLKGTLSQRNKAFNNLSPEIQRLEIAWDALNLVLQVLVKPNECGYWSDPLRNINGNSKVLQKTLNDKTFYQKNECEVCQRGLMMVSQIRLGNSIGDDDCDRSDGNEGNVKGFSIESFEKMESEYEHNAYNHPYDTHTKEKLANICCNVLNNGDFNVDDKTDYLIN